MADVFFDIFCNYNFQMIWLLKNPIDAWSKAMWKMACDVVIRIFDAIAMIDDEKKSLTKDHLIQCFLLGKSNINYLKAITKFTKHPGKQILVEDGKKTKEYFSSNIFNQPVAIYKNDIKGWLKSSDKVSQDYEFRYAFSHEQDSCTVQADETDASFNFFKADQYNSLYDQKESILKEIINKFISKDKKVIDSLKEVILENFGDVLSDLQELKQGQKELIVGQNAILETTQEMKQMIMDGFQLQKSQNLPQGDLHEMVPLKKQDHVTYADPGTLLFIIKLF